MEKKKKNVSGEDLLAPQRGGGERTMRLPFYPLNKGGGKRKSRILLSRKGRGEKRRRKRGKGLVSTLGGGGGRKKEEGVFLLRISVRTRRKGGKNPSAVPTQGKGKKRGEGGEGFPMKVTARLKGRGKRGGGKRNLKFLFFPGGGGKKKGREGGDIVWSQWQRREGGEGGKAVPLFLPVALLGKKGKGRGKKIR